jgi:anti-sigma factor RsiW
MSDPQDDIVGTISDFLDGLLAPPEADNVARKIESDEQWKHTHAELVETRKALSGLQKAHAPASFAQEVTSTIHKRSAGRFFGRRSLGDRVPFTVLVVIAVLGMAIVGYVYWTSQTGSLEGSRNRPSHAPGSAGEIVPRP